VNCVVLCGFVALCAALFVPGRAQAEGRLSKSASVCVWEAGLELIVDDLLLTICSVSSAFLGVLCGFI